MATTIVQPVGLAPAEFLASFYGDASGWLALWRSDTKGTYWLNVADGGWRASVDASVEATQVPGEEFDLYFGCALQRERTGGRGDAAGASVVPGVWADIDFGNKPNLSPAAVKKNYPPAEVAWSVIRSMPASPTYVVSSGGGLHVYWLFDKPFVIETDADRERIAAILKGWQGMLRAKLLKAGGYGIDSTFDLPRVLRVPGSVHTKHPGRVVTVEEGDGSLRYAADTMEGWLTTIATPPANGKAINGLKAEPKPAEGIRRDAEPPAVKLENLIVASPEFAALWGGRTKRPSPSEYDMSLSNFAINAGWSDDEAESLLVSFARKYFPDHLGKLNRNDYLRRTIGKAHENRRAADPPPAREQAGRAADPSPASEQAGRAAEFIARVENLDDPQQVAGAREGFIGRFAFTENPGLLGAEFDSALARESERRRSPLESIRRALAIPSLIEIRKNGTQDALLEFVIDDPKLGRVTISLGTSYDVINVPKKVRTRFMESGIEVNFPPQLTKPMLWDPIAQQIMRAAVFYKVPGIAQQIASGVIEAMGIGTGTLNGEFTSAAQSGEDFETFVLRQVRSPSSPSVFWQDEKPELWINAQKLRYHMSAYQGRVFNDREFFACLRGMEFEQVQFQKRIGGRNTKACLWKGVLPESAGFGD